MRLHAIPTWLADWHTPHVSSARSHRVMCFRVVPPPRRWRTSTPAHRNTRHRNLEARLLSGVVLVGILFQLSLTKAHCDCNLFIQRVTTPRSRLSSYPPYKFNYSHHSSLANIGAGNGNEPKTAQVSSISQSCGALLLPKYPPAWQRLSAYLSISRNNVCQIAIAQWDPPTRQSVIQPVTLVITKMGSRPWFRLEKSIIAYQYLI